MEAAWPPADAIIGNPPFLGDKKMINELGEDYTAALRACYLGRVAGGADLVTYWFEKARTHIKEGKAKRSGLVATNSIRQKRNRPVLERILNTAVSSQTESGNGSLSIFEAWSDEPWVNAGAAVRVSLIAFGADRGAILDGQPVKTIHANLTAGDGLDLTQARPLKKNADWSYFGLCLAGPFKVSAETAQDWLKLPNPHGRPNSDVLKPIYNGSDITRRWAGDWVIDFGLMSEQEAALYETPFFYVTQHVKPIRTDNKRKARAEKWWRHGEARPGLRRKLSNVQRYIATPETAKHRFFVWLPINVTPEHRLVLVPCEHNEIFGILSSRIHIVWALAIGGTLEDRPVYNSTLCFETFPFPAGLMPNDDLASNPHGNTIASAARRIDELRENWLNPPEWVDWVITPEEEKVGYPPQPIAKPGFEAELKKRTLTQLYNIRPTWLDNAHKMLDKAVATAYGWADYTSEMTDAEILRRLLSLNIERSKNQ